jgi:hypothetical protein
LKLTALVLGLVAAGSLAAQERSEITLPPAFNGRNQRAEVSQWIGLVKVTIGYHSPNVHAPNGEDRTGHIWGELVRYGLFDEGFGPSTRTPWRAGANETTTITVSHDVQIGGQTLKAGTYALFLLLDEKGPWTWIFSTNIGWGSFQYDPKFDVARVSATPKAAAFTEFLTYGFDQRGGGSAVAYLQWENQRIDFKIEVPNIDQLYVDQIRKDLLGWPGFSWQNWQAAAQFCADHKINLEEALVWADKAITEVFRNAAPGHRDFTTLSTKAAVLAAMNRVEEADRVMDQALGAEGATPDVIYRYGMTVLRAGRTPRAVAIFERNRVLNPGEKFFTSLGLARGYTAAGQKAKAIESWEIAIKNVPEAQRGQVPQFEAALRALKGG